MPFDHDQKPAPAHSSGEHSVGVPASPHGPNVRAHVLHRLQRYGPGPEALADLIKDAGREAADVVAVLHEVVGNYAVSKADEVLQARAEAARHARIAARWRDGALPKARKLSDADLTGELGEVRGELGERSALHREPDDAYFALRSAQTELEFEARRRGAGRGKAGSLDPMETPGALSFTDEQSGRASGAAPARSAALRKLDYAIATLGLDGAEREIQRLESEITAESKVTAEPGAGEGSHATTEPMTWLRSELAQRREEGEAFLERFEHVGRSIALGMLSESASRLQSELSRYGLRRGEAHSDGSLRGMGLAPGESGAAISDAVAHGQAIRAAYDRARASGAAERSAWEEFEKVKARAISTHPILASFLAGDTELAKAAPTGMVPDALELGNQPPALLGGMIGWELNQKLVDNRATTANLETGKLSIFGAPRVVELTKLQMRVADGMMLSGVVDERVRHPVGAAWTEHLSSAITVALGLMLMVPTGGASSVAVGVAMAGSLALLASDLYLIGKSSAERSIPGAAANTDILLEQSLLDEEPAAAPLLTQLLSGLGLAAGVTGVLQGVAHVRELAQARQGITDLRALRRTFAAHGADVTHPNVQAAADRLRATAHQAGLPPGQTEAMIRTALRNGGAGAPPSPPSSPPLHAENLANEVNASETPLRATLVGEKGADSVNTAMQAERAELVLQEIERGAGGLRRPALETIEPEEIARIQREFIELGGNPSMLRFNYGRRTAYDDEFDTIQICGDVNPVSDSLHPRSAMSSKAALGHELGHAAHRGTPLPIGAWNDEFRASYWAAKNLPNLSEQDRIHLILDAMERAREAGVTFNPNALMRRILYGY